jgi:hypothetical protein
MAKATTAGKIKKTAARRIVLTATATDREALDAFAELEAAAKLNRRDVGDYVLVSLLNMRGGTDAGWFGRRGVDPDQTELEFKVGGTD